MMKCHRCGTNKFWKLKSGKVRCSGCRISFRPRTGGVFVPMKALKTIIAEFDLEHSTNVILERCAISKHSLLKLLTTLRTEMTKDTPRAFSGIVERWTEYIWAGNGEINA